MAKANGNIWQVWLWLLEIYVEYGKATRDMDKYGYIYWRFMWSMAEATGDIWQEWLWLLEMYDS